MGWIRACGAAAVLAGLWQGDEPALRGTWVFHVA
jgi:hypothetical protein